MRTIQEFLDAIGLNVTLLIGGAIGSFISRKKDKPIWQQFIYVITAAFIANYTAPLIVELFELSEKTLPGVGFILGYAELGMLDYVLNSFKKKVDKQIND